MGARRRRGRDLELSRRVAACSGRLLDERGINIKSRKDKVFIQVAGAELVWVATSGGVSTLLSGLLKGEWWVTRHFIQRQKAAELA